MRQISQQIVDMGILTKKGYNDCQHIVDAVIYEYDCIVIQKHNVLKSIRKLKMREALTDELII